MPPRLHTDRQRELVLEEDWFKAAGDVLAKAD